MPGFASFVLETANNSGTGSFALAGAPPGRRRWSSAFKDGDQVCYFADDGTQAEWGIGQLSHGQPATISRSKVLGTTSESTNRINFTGLVYVYSDRPAEIAPLPVVQGQKNIQVQSWKERLFDLGSVDVTATGPTLRAEFDGSFKLDTNGTSDTNWQVLRIIISVYTLDGQGNISATPITSRAGNIRIDRRNYLSIGARALAQTSEGTDLRIKVSSQVMDGSDYPTILGITQIDSAISWLCA